MSSTTARAEVTVSWTETLRGALALPFSPRRCSRALDKISGIRGAVVVVTAFSVLYSIARSTSISDYWEFDAGDFVSWVIQRLLYFAILVYLSAAFMRGSSTTRTKYSANANLIAYWFAWQSMLSAVLVLLSPSLAISGENIVYLVVSLTLFFWFLIVFVVALSVAYNAPLRRCWVPGFAALFTTGLITACLGIFLAGVINYVL